MCLEEVSAGILAATNADVSVMAASRDAGAIEPEPDLKTVYPFPVALFSASDPLVTSVGGTWLHLDAARNRVRPGHLFDDADGSLVSGADLSAFFPSRPGKQRPVHRGDTAGVSIDGSGCPPQRVYQH